MNLSSYFFTKINYPSFPMALPISHNTSVTSIVTFKKRAPKGPFDLTEAGRSPPGISPLLEDCHDFVDYFTENDGVVVPSLDKITTLLNMLAKG